MKNIFVLILCSLILVFQLGKSNAQTKSLPNKVQSNYHINKYVIGVGGVIRSTGQNQSHYATAGEVFVSNVHSTNNLLYSGFWHDVDFTTTKVNQEETEKLLLEFKLYQNYPNPFNPQTSIQYNLPNECFVNVEVFNLAGYRICSLLNQEIQGPGHMEIIWDGQDAHGKSVGSGVYLYRIIAFKTSKDVSLKKEAFQHSRKMLLVK